MMTIEEIKEQVLSLSAEEQAELRDWLDDLDWESWDKQLERDVRAGKLDALAEEALREDAEGKTTPL
jgi:hypothetical protein